MMTGDHIETAKRAAIDCGLITELESEEQGVVLLAEDFKKLIGEYKKIRDGNGYSISFDTGDQGRQAFDKVKKKCKVIARCTPEEKLIMICGIQNKGGLVGMTGDSISDAEALKKANVGFCMKDGVDVAKDNSDLVILDNNFESIYSSIQWGRAIFANVKKFLQFQLTINIVICFITILGGATTGTTPLNVIQMLWVNLIMDILGAIAIGTEPYKSSGIAPEGGDAYIRVSRKHSILN